MTSPIVTRRFVYPTVRPLSAATAHPAAEAWPEHPGVRRQAVAHRAGGAPGARARVAQFDRVQEKLGKLEAAVHAEASRQLVVVPSRTIDKPNEHPALSQALEERMLCYLLELQDPNLRMTYVTSSPVSESVVGYYLSLLPSRMRAHARRRLRLVALGDRAMLPLADKLLRRRGMLARLSRAIGGDIPACLVPYQTTSDERDLALALQVPLFGADPRHSHLGTKSGCRGLFERAGVPHPLGAEGITGVETAIEAMLRLRARQPKLSRLVMKLNDGVAGEGNALVELGGLPVPGSAGEPAAVAKRVYELTPECAGLSASAFLRKLATHGGIAEEWITGRDLQSPSVQLQIEPSGEIRLLSTHDQILGGATNQTYLGCRFPAAPTYAPQISAHARRVAELLAHEGVIGRFAIDFVVARDERGSWKSFAIELNLRKGATTHPFETLRGLTGGSYDGDRATFVTRTGQHKYYVATDRLEAPALRALGRDGMLEMARSRRLRFDRMRRSGVVFHMLSGLDEVGRAGFTAIGDTAEEAAELYAHAEDLVMARAERAMEIMRRTAMGGALAAA